MVHVTNSLLRRIYWMTSGSEHTGIFYIYLYSHKFTLHQPNQTMLLITNTCRLPRHNVYAVSVAVAALQRLCVLFVC